MRAFFEIVSAHPVASAWLAATIWFWIAVHAETGGARRRRRSETPPSPPMSDQA